MNKKFEAILVSSPNGGGIFLIQEDCIFRLDNFDTTGLFFGENGLLRGLQPAEFRTYEYTGCCISSASISCEDVHDVHSKAGFSYVVGTNQNEILKLNLQGEELQRWVFPGEEDSWHINCLGDWGGRIVFSAFGDFRMHRGYKGGTEGAGFVQDLLTGDRLITGLSQPHSLVSFGQNLLLANSERMELLEFLPSGELFRSKQLDGYVRGICVGERAIYVGLSRSRNIESEGPESAAVVCLDIKTFEEIERIFLPTNEVYGLLYLPDKEKLISVVAAISASSSDKLTAMLSERSGQIGDLNQVIAERDGQIENLNLAVSERDGQIGNLSQVVAERDGQIEHLNQAVSERDGQIGNLNQVVAARDGQIENLNQTVSEHNGQIAYLRSEVGHLVTYKDAAIHTVRQDLNRVIHSRSWRVTAPLRKIVTIVRKMAETSRGKFLQGIIKIFMLRRDRAFGSATRLIKDSPLFDAEYYLTRNPDVQNTGVDPAKHYLFQGWQEHRDPSALFSTSQYLFDNSDVARAQINPLIHYLRHGRREGRLITPPTSASELPSQHTSAHSEVDAIRRSGLFDEGYYRSMYPDLQPESLDLVEHYCEYGWREGKNPSDNFDTNFYLASYSDIRAADINPFWHYVVAGASEQRSAVSTSGPRHENDIRFGAIGSELKLIAFYASPNWAALRSGQPNSKVHSQALVPHDTLGFYEPSDFHVLKHQAELAKCHGLHGFCFDLAIGEVHEGSVRPIEAFLHHHDIELSFCLHTEMPFEDTLAPLITFIARAVSDRRYICVEGKPLIVLTISDERTDAARTVSQLKHCLADQGIGDIFLIGRRASVSKNSSEVLVADVCDALLDLPGTPVPEETGTFVPLRKNGVDTVPYSVIASQGIARARRAHGSTYPLYHTVVLGRDNTSLKSERPLVYTRFHVKEYRRWLEEAISCAKFAHPEDRRFVFINSWNDWNEGSFLEPDRQGGFDRLNETARALLNIKSCAIMPKVSVIVPNYNHECFLHRRLDSIYGQTYKNIEVILMDDCSSDQSRSLMNLYAAAHSEITRTLYNDLNSGSAFRQWAKGIKEATGDLIWIAESDDYCDERFLEVLVRCFEDEAVLLAYSKCTFVNKDGILLQNEFQIYVSDLECAEKWNHSYVETAHNEVKEALGIKNTIPNASGVLFKRPIDMPLLNDETWLSMAVAGDWVFYLHLIRGGKIAYETGTTNFFRRYEGSTAEVTYKAQSFYSEVGRASRAVATLYNVPLKTLEKCRQGFREFYQKMVGESDEKFALWYDYESILRARKSRLPNVLVSTMAFHPGGAEILPIRLANEFKRQGLSVLLLNAGLMSHEPRIREMLRSDIPVVETSSVEEVRAIIHEFGVEVLNTHQWHIQKYPLQVKDVFDELSAHVASLHGMIEYGEAFAVTETELRGADQSVTTWVYTAEKNLVPFKNADLYDRSSSRFIKIPNGMQPPHVVPMSYADLGIPPDAFVLCCVSRAIPDKGWAETILVVKRARALSGRDIRLILVGNGPVYDEYRRLGLPEFVYLAGFSENAVGYYAAADMGIMLTKFKSESFPLTIIDCLFAGKPYIASDVGDIKNILTTSGGIAGDVIELEEWEVPIEKTAQVVASFATDKQRWLNAVALVQGIADRHRIDVVASQYVRLFERAVLSII